MTKKKTVNHETKVNNKNNAGASSKFKKSELSIYLEEVVTTHLDSKQTNRVYIVGGELGGDKYQTHLTESEFDNMNIGIKLFGEKLILKLGKKLRPADIIELIQDCRKDYKKIHLYRYQGFCYIENELAYLSSNGVLNKNGWVHGHRVEIATGYSCKPEFSKIPKMRRDKVELIKQTLELLEPKETPLLGLATLAPATRSVLTHIVPNKATCFYLGDTGSWKSTIAAIAQSFLLPGTTEESLSLNFQSTTKGMRLLSAGFNNSVLVIDDYNTKKIDEELIEFLTIGNSQSTGRHTAKSATELDPTLKTNNVNIITGEVAFNTDKDSRHHRIVYLEFIPKMIPGNKLTEIQELASKGVFYQTMMLFVRWILSNHESLEKRVQNKYESLRRKAANDLPKGTHLRLCENAADFFLGIYFFIVFCVERKVLAKQDRKKYIKYYWKRVIQIISNQKQIIEQYEPQAVISRAIVKAIKQGDLSVMSYKSKRFIPFTKDSHGEASVPEFLGYVKNKSGDVCVPTDISPQTILKVLPKKVKSLLPATQTRFWNELHDLGIHTPSHAGNKNRLTVDGKLVPYYLLHLPELFK